MGCYSWIAEIFSWHSFVLGLGVEKQACHRENCTVYAENGQLCNKGMNQQREALYPQNSTVPCLQMLGVRHKSNCATSNFASFRHQFISHSSLKIVWEILHTFETRNIPQRKNPVTKFPPCTLQMKAIHQQNLSILVCSLTTSKQTVGNIKANKL